jgi:hypothetical protein
MPSKIQFLLPSLFQKHCREFLEDSAQAKLLELLALMSRSKKQPAATIHQWIDRHLNIEVEYLNSAKMMAVGEGLITSTEKDSNYWLRADPIMLSATHNGILCRGNRVLNLTKEERLSIEVVINDYLKEQSMTLIMINSRQGYLTVKEPLESEFTALFDIVGQDITHRLPKGNKSKYWHTILTDLQMLLHGCEVNRKRQENQQPEVKGFWIWAETDNVIQEVNVKVTESQLFTDDAALAGALGTLTNLSSLPEHFDQEQYIKDAIIHVSELAEAYHQNDMEGWQLLFQKWVINWLLPAIQAVDDKQLTEVILQTDDGYCYRYNSYSKWCIWRNHSFD